MQPRTGLQILRTVRLIVKLNIRSHISFGYYECGHCLSKRPGIVTAACCREPSGAAGRYLTNKRVYYKLTQVSMVRPWRVRLIAASGLVNVRVQHHTPFAYT